MNSLRAQLRDEFKDVSLNIAASQIVSVYQKRRRKILVASLSVAASFVIAFIAALNLNTGVVTQFMHSTGEFLSHYFSSDKSEYHSPAPTQTSTNAAPYAASDKDAKNVKKKQKKKNSSVLETAEPTESEAAALPSNTQPTAAETESAQTEAQTAQPSEREENETKAEQITRNGIRFSLISGDGKTVAEASGCVDSITTLVIPSEIDGYPVTQIGDNAFMDNKNLRSVVIPENVEAIGFSAFERCSSLKSISFPKTLKAVEDRAFKGCSKIDSIYLSDLKAWNKVVFALGEGLGAFPNNNPNTVYVNNKKLEELVVTKDFEAVNERILQNCTGLKRLVISEGIKKIDYGAFSGCSSLKEITLPDSLEEIFQPFNGCSSLKKIEIPRNVKSISAFSFGDCTSLTEVEFNAVACKKFGYKFEPVFMGCTSLKTVKIGKNVTDIAYYIFNDSGSDIEIVGAAGSYAEQFADENGYRFIAN